MIKFRECLIFYNAVELTVVLNQLKAEGHSVRAEDVAPLSSYMTRHIRRFGDYVLDLSPPGAVAATSLDLDDQHAEPTSTPEQTGDRGP